ncbi:MAG: sodium:proton antiporter NhaD [Candidatus Pacebacteria bacterium]|nr:sodium:proton antiporter NhaD [Candidatus Paceibacterota bacterium]
MSDFVYYGVMFAGVLGLAGMMFGQVKIPYLALASGIAWGIIFIFHPHELADSEAEETAWKTFELIAFLIPVMTIIEGGVHYGMMDAVLRVINTTHKRTLMFIVGIMSFILSALLDNITASIIMSILVVQLMYSKEDRLKFIVLIIAGANAGGVPSAIGNTTSILLWVGGQLSIKVMFTALILPTIVYMLVIFGFFWPQMDGNVERPVPDQLDTEQLDQDKLFHLPVWQQWGILFLVLTCIGIIIGGKVFFHIPPWVGAMLSLGFWGLFTWRVNKVKGDHFLEERSVRSVLKHIDHNTVFMFMLLLPLISAMGHVGILGDLATKIVAGVQDFAGEEAVVPGVAIVLGLISSVVPNTPLVAASQSMFSYEQDHLFWEMLNYTTGVGGALLPMGTSAGMILMSRFRGTLTVKSYVKKAFVPLLLAFFAGLAVLYVQKFFM